MYTFVDRHIGPNSVDVSAMLAAVGYKSLDDLMAAATPASIRLLQGLELPAAASEVEVLAELKTLASKNSSLTNFIGQGYYGTHVPAVIQRNVLENPAWYTSYTPYQPEISQGRLEALLNFQTMICDLTGLEIAGASLLDEPTAAAEAMTLMMRQYKGSNATLLVDVDTHPQTLAVLNTRAKPLGIVLRLIDTAQPVDFSDAFGVFVSSPGTSGTVVDHTKLIAEAHAAGILVAVATDLLATMLTKTPGEMNADIAIGSAQRFGVPMAMGGPHAGFMAVRSGLERSMPGRLVGVSVDSHGNPAYRLALQTREQHIRREKATSNICTAQALLAICSAMYASYHGWDGLVSIASGVHAKASRVKNSVVESGLKTLSDNFFDTVSFAPAQGADKAVSDALSAGFNIRKLNSTHVTIAVDETTTDQQVDDLLNSIGIKPSPKADSALASGLSRSSTALNHPVFSRYRSETEMMRYLRKLSDLDLALDRTMIPLGSCTMKLNAATEMASITWPEFAGAHPYAPANQNLGWIELITQLEEFLCEVTGYDAVSLQPNAGSQGEFAGLLAVSAYHASRGEAHRDVCLIPNSAHGTNAASAVMAGMKVVVITCDESGNVDLDDLRAKIAMYADRLSALMITYPSTHGVYEDTITEICALIHEAGGQVYVDGANLNALVGVAKPGKFGADVSHLNLHKTFCIPHGGGGPGVGPVAVRQHLAPFLPGDPLSSDPTTSGAVSGANYGSAGILPIPFAYIRMMSGDGLKHATEVAVLSANYIATKLSSHFPILYTNAAGLIAHECIIDIRDITKRSGVSVDDVAKRLVDYGFHAPTMSFPVAGTLMIEPTESESIEEIDRFINAMLSIADEIADIESGKQVYETSALHNAPHTALAMISSEQDTSAKMQAALPAGVNPVHKYWPPVGRIDGAFGDRNLTCTCPPIEDLAADI
ncbi:MAG: hypothetical protein RLZZ426_785 [Actinomycetota bacterium]